MTQATADGVEAAKQALAVKDWNTARMILAPLLAKEPSGLPGLLLARAELELGRPEVAVLLVTAFRALRPRHVGATVLAARAHLAAGELDKAEGMARVVLELEPGSEVALRLLESIASAAVTRDLAGPIAVVDAGYLEARTGAAGPDLLRAAEELRAVVPGPDWVSDADQAKVAYFHNARGIDEALRSYDPHLIDLATRFDYLTWPKRIQEHIGESVLDVGCGPGGVGVGYLVAGASSYLGVDPAVELDTPRARNRRTRRWEDIGVTPRQISEAIPAIQLVASAIEDLKLDRTFDTIVLHNVSEHLADLDQVLACLTSLCRPQTKVVLLHHSYYSWNGHKRQPRWPGQYDASNPEHEKVYDWRHIDAVPNLPGDHELLGNLNRLRLDDLRGTIERHFVVTEWDEVTSDEATRARLTPAIVDRVRSAVPDITERELTVNNVFCVARPQAE